MRSFLNDFAIDSLITQASLFDESPTGNVVNVRDDKYTRFVGEFWTAKQRQSSSLHEIAYRACFKAQLPNFFISRLTKEGDTVYDPFSGRGTTVVEAALNGRNGIANDINPISKILTEGRLSIPELSQIQNRLDEIPIEDGMDGELNLSMFYHPDTFREIISLKNYFLSKVRDGRLDNVDKWIRMIATNRLTGHSPGYFSVYTLPPNQAVSPDRQVKINVKYAQEPTYRNTKKLIYKKSISLQKNLLPRQLKNLKEVSTQFLCNDARYTPEIADESVSLTVTSPPFLDIVQYAQDNWLRCWFNGVAAGEIENKITMVKSVESWSEVMSEVFKELFRITKSNGWVAFEVGEVRNGKINLEDYVIPIGEETGFVCDCVMINEQVFTKTANIWGVKNNSRGTNTNRIVVFNKK